MRRWPFLVFPLLTACGQGPDADLQSIKQARSIAAEWALINEQARMGKVTGTYAYSMHRWLRDGLQTASKSLQQPNSRYGNEIHSLLAEPPGADPGTLRRHADVLKQIETKLESA